MGEIESKKGTGLFDNGLIWFGAGVSIAEILTGTYFAPLGFWNGTLTIVIGHMIGILLLYLAGIIGSENRLSQMETVKKSFGFIGGTFFAIVNVIQLLGWTAIMIYDGALAISSIFDSNPAIWALVIGSLIIFWILIGISNLRTINTIAMLGLFILTLVLFTEVCDTDVISFEGADDLLSFGGAIELAIAMPISWIPLISDYTREAKMPKKATKVSVITYGLTSTWMYMIGMCGSILTGENDIAKILIRTGLGTAWIIIVIMSTVTTTFLDAFSAGISFESIFKKINGKYVALICAVLGTICAIFYPMDDITDFLYLIGSVFCPMIAIQIADYFILRRDKSKEKFDLRNIIIWIMGFVIYRLILRTDFVIGSTIPSIAVTAVIAVISHFIFDRKKGQK